MLTTTIACGQPKSPDTPSPTELIIGFPEGNVAAPDLGANQFTNNLTREGLTSRPNLDGRAVPRLAESWHWEEEGLRLRFKLRPGVLFHDGTPMTASVVATILEKALDSADVEDAYASLADVRSVRADGELEVVLELSRRSAFLPEDLIMPLSLPENVSTGPFRLVKREEKEITFERFDRYYEGRPTIQRIRVKTFDTLRTAWSSLLRGEVDMVTDVPAEAVDFFRNDEVDVIPYKRSYQYMLAFNGRRPTFASATVRRALNIGVNREALIQRALRGYGSVATGPLWPLHWAYDPSVPSFAFDQGQATTLLDQAGLVEGKAGAQSHVPGARLKFTCLLNGDFSLHERVGLELQKQLYDIGVDMQFEVVSFDEYNARILDGRFEAVLVDLSSGPTLSRPYIFWRSAATFQGFNVFGYENPETERLFDVLRASALNEGAIRSATNRLQRAFHDDPPALFLAWSQRARVVGPKFQPEIEPDLDPVPTMWRWKLNDTRIARSQ